MLTVRGNRVGRLSSSKAIEEAWVRLLCTCPGVLLGIFRHGRAGEDAHSNAGYLCRNGVLHMNWEISSSPFGRYLLARHFSQAIWPAVGWSARGQLM